MADYASDNAPESDSVTTIPYVNTGKTEKKFLVSLWIITLINTLVILVGIGAYSTRTDGKWSSWGYWSECRYGQRTRTRSCNNPEPSAFGQYCQGFAEKYRICNLVSCKDNKLSAFGFEGWSIDSKKTQQSDNDHRKSVAFTAHSLDRKPSFDTIITFTKVEFNMGNAYNNGTGKFTCRTAGTYYFSVTLTKFYKRITYLSAYLRVNGKNKFHLLSDPSNKNDNEIEAQPLTASGTYYLNKGDEVYIFGAPDNFYGGVHSQFTGFLISSAENDP